MITATDVARMIEALPPAIEPFYRQGSANGPILLARAPIVVSGEGGQETANAEFRLDFLPRPALLADVFGQLSVVAFEAILRPDSVAPSPQLPTDRVPPPPSRKRQRNNAGSRWAERFLSLDVGSPNATLRRAVLHLVNWPSLYGAAVRRGDAMDSRSRITLNGGGWVITVDRLAGAQKREEEAQANSGCALTHVAEVRRIDGRSFTPPELRDISDAMSYLGSFAHGFRCGAVLPVGFDEQDSPRWAHWSTGWIQGATGAYSWLDAVHPDQLAQLFPGFMARWQDPYWQRVLRLAIRYYLDSNVPSTVELATALAQVVLEMLSHSWLVIERQLKTTKEFDSGKHRTTRNLRDMLRDMGIPIRIPDHFVALATWRPGGEQLDGPWAIVELRNRMIHVRPEQHPRRADYQHRVDGWKLATWYVELAVLRICHYPGTYRNRVRADTLGTVDTVPWAISPAASLVPK